jgi:hypothetical protein
MLKYFIEPHGNPEAIALAKAINAILSKPLVPGKWLNFPDVKVGLEKGELLLTYNVNTVEDAEHLQGKKMNSFK